jgi:hypothetical protein
MDRFLHSVCITNVFDGKVKGKEEEKHCRTGEGMKDCKISR